MKLKMLKTAAGSPDGLTVLRYERHAEVEVPEALARVFCGQGWARPLKPARTKDAGAAPENKSASRRRRRHGA